MDFPLYNHLLKDVVDDDLSKEKKEEFAKNIKAMNAQGHKLVYVLIRRFSVDNEECKTDGALPYEGKYMKKNLKFELERFPNRLKQMLHQFTVMHLQEMEIAQAREQLHI